MHSIPFSKCLVLGGRGFIGSHLVDRLLDEGVSTRILARRPPADALPSEKPSRSDKSLEVVTGDFSNDQDLLKALEGCDACVHLISTTLPKTSNDNMIYDIQTNLIGTVRLLQLAKEVGLKRLVFASSGGAVYGDALYAPINETHPTNPRSSYGITKLASEKYLDLFADERLSTLILRLANPFGPRQRTTMNQGAIAVFLDRALRDQEIVIWGDGNVVRDYIYIDDCVSAFIAALSYGGEERLFNIGSGEGRSLNELLAVIEAVVGRKLNVSYTSGRSVDAPRNTLSIERALKEFDWRPGTSFEEGLARTAQWLRDNSDR